MFARFLLTACVLGCAVFVPPALAMDMREEAGVRLEWRSEKQDPAELARDLERFYVVLYNTGNLPVREIRDPKQSAMRVEDLLRSERLFFGGFFPIGVDAVMCDLNPQICDRERVEVSAKELSLVADHVGGYRKTPGRWTNDSGAVVLVPGVVFDQFATITERPLSPKEDVEALSQASGIDCTERWKLSCSDLVQRLNPAIFDSKRKAGSRPRVIKLPTQGLRAEIVLAGVRDKRDLSPTFTGVGQVTTEVRDDRLDRFAASWRDALKSLAPAALTVEALHDNIPSFGPAKAEGLGDAHFAEQRSLLELINHPFINGGENRDELKQPVPIAVFDFLFDRNHCELKDSVVVDALAPPGPDDVPATPEPQPDRTPAQRCGDLMRGAPNMAFDHGTHVAGIIGSKANADGVVGLNPFARLHYVSLNQPKLLDSKYRDRIAEKMFDLGIIAAEPVKVVNLSWTYVNLGGNADAIRKRIIDLNQNTLFVVAAGNDNKERSGDDCGDFPACFRDRANVITVVGLDRTQNPPKLWHKSDEEGSNWGPDFGVGAIASDVLSTTYSGGIGVMSGTSQAAPQVTAAASLMYSVFETHFRVDQPELLPIRVKNRLIYTSDMFNDLLDRVKGGRLNVERAIDFAHDWLSIRKDGVVKQYQGKLVKFGNFEVGQEYIECALPGEQGSRQIKLVDLRRMFYDEFREKYVIFFNSVSGDADSELSRLVSCELTTRTHEGVFEAEPDDTEIPFQFKDIRDYISSMY